MQQTQGGLRTCLSPTLRHRQGWALQFLTPLPSTLSKTCFSPLSRGRGLRQVSMPLTRVQRGPWNPTFLKVPLPTLATALPLPPLAPLLTNLITLFIPSDASHPTGPRSHPSSPLPSNPHLLHIGWLPGVAAPPSSEKLLFCGKELISPVKTIQDTSLHLWRVAFVPASSHRSWLVGRWPPGLLFLFIYPWLSPKLLPSTPSFKPHLLDTPYRVGVTPFSSLLPLMFL